MKFRKGDTIVWIDPENGMSGFHARGRDTYTSIEGVIVDVFESYYVIEWKLSDGTLIKEPHTFSFIDKTSWLKRSLEATWYLL